MERSFNNLDTVQFSKRMHPYAEQIYKNVFGGCDVQDLRTHGKDVHILDKEFGIDTLVILRSGQWLSIQEKYRRFKHLLEFGDFTQEYMNAAGTKYESQGEWFKLGAQLYFYGWANRAEDGFEKWLILDIPLYKLLIESCGGLEQVGKFRQNTTYGRAIFCCVPLGILSSAILYCSWKQTPYRWIPRMPFRSLASSSLVGGNIVAARHRPSPLIKARLLPTTAQTIARARMLRKKLLTSPQPPVIR